MAEQDAILRLRAEADYADAQAKAEQLRKAHEELTPAAEQAADALKREADTAVQSADRSVSAAEESAAALGSVVTSAEQAESAVGDLGASSAENLGRAEAATRDLSAAMVEVATKITTSGESLTNQQGALREYEARLTEIASGYRASGEASKAHAEAAQAALGPVREQLAKVTAELTKQQNEYPGLSEKAQAALGAIAKATVTVDEATINAAAAIAKARVEMDETGHVGARSIGFAAQAVENYKLAVQEAGTTDEATRQKEIEVLKQLEGELTKVTARANALTNAAKDNSVALKESGNRIAGVGMAVQQLTSNLGPAGEGLGKVAGNAAMLSIGVEQVKDALNGLRAGSLLPFLGELALAAAAIIGTVKALDLFSEAYKHADDDIKIANESLRLAHEANRTIWLDHKATVEAQNKNTESANALYAAMRSLSDILKRTGDHAASMRAYADEIEKALKANSQLTEAERKRDQLIVELLRKGDQLTAAQKKFLQTLIDEEKYGRAANGVLNTLAEASLKLDQATGGSTQKLRDASAALDVLTRDYGRNREAVRDVVSGMQTLLDKTDGLSDAQRRNAQRQIDAINAIEAAQSEAQARETARTTAMVQAQDQTTTAVVRHRVEVQGYLADLQALVPQSARYGDVLRDIGKLLGDVATNSGALGVAERERLTIIAELVARGDALTESQRKIAEQLIASAKAGDQVTAAMNAAARIHAQLDTATSGTTEKLTALTGAIDILVKEGWEKNSIAIARAIGELGTAIGATDGLTESQRALYDEIIAGQQKLEGLTGTLASLKDREREIIDELATASAERARALAAEYDQVEAQIRQANDRIAQQRGTIDLTRDAIKIEQEHAVAQKGSVDATKQVIGVNEDGHKSITQVAADTRSASDETEHATRVIAGSAEPIAKAYQQWLASGKNVEAIGETVTETASLTTAAAEKIVEAWPPAASAFEKTAERVKSTVDVFDLLHESADSTLSIFNALTRQSNELADALDRVTESSKNAAGSGTGNAPGYNNVTEGP